LSEGRGANSGFVQIFLEEQWANVVNNDWVWKDTSVVCRQLDPTWQYVLWLFSHRLNIDSDDDGDDDDGDDDDNDDIHFIVVY